MVKRKTTKQRVTELRMVPAKELRADPRNWRKHPKEQREALQAMLDAVGIVGAVIARETDDGLVLVDGHLRADMLDVDVPVLVVDIDESEAGQVIATFDPIAAMAQSNTEALQALIDAGPPTVEWDTVMPSAARVDLPPLIDLTQGKADETRQNNNLKQFGGERYNYIGIDGKVTHLPPHITDWLREDPVGTLEAAYHALGNN